MDKAQKAYDELKKGIQNYIKISLDNVPMDKTFTALIKSYGEEEGTYNIILNNTEYKNVPSLGGTCVINETVRVMIPQNNYTNMFILKSASEGGGGEGDRVALPDPHAGRAWDGRNGVFQYSVRAVCPVLRDLHGGASGCAFNDDGKKRGAWRPFRGKPHLAGVALPAFEIVLRIGYILGLFLVGHPLCKAGRLDR